METAKEFFNENIFEIDFTVHVSLLTLDRLGWSFEDLIDYEINSIEAKNSDIEHENMVRENCENFEPIELISIDYDEVKKQLFSDLVASIQLGGNVEEFSTSIEINTTKDFFNFISNGCGEGTGDNEQTIKDIVKILTEKDFSIENHKSMYGSQRSYPSVDDYSVDVEGNYISLFKNLKTMK
jgi:hypothetical protein